MASASNAFIVALKFYECFYHERLGAVLVCERHFIKGGLIVQRGLLMLRTPTDGNPVYLQSLADYFAANEERLIEQPRFSAN